MKKLFLFLGLALIAVALLSFSASSFTKKESIKSYNSVETSGTVSPCIGKPPLPGSYECTTQYDPVCGCNGVTYSNSCEASKAGVLRYTKGACNSTE